MLRGAAYIRVSTTEQIEFSPEAQKKAIFSYAKKNDIKIENKYIFADEGFSGRTATKRPQFMRMIKLAKLKPRPFDVIIVHRFDRFARNREDSVVYKALLRKDCGIQVVSVTEQLEDDKFSIILESMLEAMAEYYSLNLADEVKKGMTEKAKRGGFQSKPPLGYKIKDKGQTPVIDSKEAKVIEYIYSKFVNENIQPSIITKDLNKMGYRTRRGCKFETRGIRYILSNPMYCGYTRWNYRRKSIVNNQEDWIIRKGVHKPIVDKSLWDKAQERLKMNKTFCTTEKPSEYKHYLSGLLKCAYCGGRMTYCNMRGYEYFRCNKNLKGSCEHSNYVRVDKLEIAIIDKIREDMHNIEYIVDNSSVNSVQKELKILYGQLNQIKKKYLRIKEAYVAEVDNLDEYKKNKEKLLEERKNILSEIRNKENKTNSDINKKIKVITVYDYLTSKSLSLFERNRALKAIINYIKVDNLNKKITIRYSTK